VRKIDYIIALLERIALQTANTSLDFPDYLERTVRQNAIARRDEVQNEKGKQDSLSVRQGKQPRH